MESRCASTGTYKTALSWYIITAPAYWEGKGQNSLHPLAMCLVIICVYEAILWLLRDKMHCIASYGVLNSKCMQYAKWKNLSRAVFPPPPCFFCYLNTFHLCAICFWKNVYFREFISLSGVRCISKDTTSTFLPLYTPQRIESVLRPKEEVYLLNYAQRLKWRGGLLNRYTEIYLNESLITDRTNYVIQFRVN